MFKFIFSLHGAKTKQKLYQFPMGEEANPFIAANQKAVGADRFSTAPKVYMPRHYLLKSRRNKKHILV